MNYSKKDLSSLILKYMNGRKLNQSEMAKLLSVSTATLSDWLDPNKHGISRKNAIKILELCKDYINPPVIGNGNTIAQGGSTVINSSPSPVAAASVEVVEGAVESFRRAAMDNVMASDQVPDTVKPAVYTILKNTRVPRRGKD